jgi:CRP/FNR family transcriptional regulator
MSAAPLNVVGPCRHKPIADRCPSCILDASDYFATLPTPAKLALQQFLKLRTFDRRAFLYAESDRTEHLYILVSGEVKVYKSLSEGRQQIHKLVNVPGDLIACEDLFLDHHSSTAETLMRTVVCYLSKARLQDVQRQHHDVTDSLLRAMAHNLNAYIKHIANLGQKKALERVASYLVFLCETHRAGSLRGEVLSQSLTRTELADMLGVTQRTLIRSLKRLEKDRVITLDREGFIIRDPAKLTHLAG